VEEKITFKQIKNAMMAIVDELNDKRQYFNDLDSPIGDSDHGDSVCSAFAKVKEVILNYDKDKKDIGDLLMNIGKAIIFSGGAAMGPLYGSAFNEAGKVLSGKNEIDYNDLVNMWTGFISGIGKRGEKIGEKTMYDTIYPAVEALKKAHSDDIPLNQAIGLVVKAAENGMNSTKNMIAARGRSSRLGERTIGHIDPGSASMNAIIYAFFQNILD
jgi:dihydroxyacetone kinase-like protein